MKSDRHYVRVYDDDFRRDYKALWDDDACLATWLRLLSVAEKMWPTMPELPRSARDEPLAALVGAGLIILDGDCYRIKGLDAERNARRNAGRIAADVRWGNADSIAKDMPKTTRDENETKPLPPRVGKRVNGNNPRAIGTNPRALGTSPRQEREAQKRGPTQLHEILSRIQTKGPA